MEFDKNRCQEQCADYNGDDQEDQLSPEDLKAVQRGIEDIKSGRFITLEDYYKSL